VRGLAVRKKALIVAVLLLIVAGGGAFAYFYVKYTRLIDARLNGDVFNNASLIFAAPSDIRIGEQISPALLASHLRRALYGEREGSSQVGYFRLTGDTLEVHPGPISYFQGDTPLEGAALVRFEGGKIAAITSLDKPGGALESYQLEPEVITTLFGSDRSKRRIVRYQDLPKSLVGATLGAEDHRFFEHHGVNFLRIFGAALADIRAERAKQGFSTLTMQLARNFFLSPEKTLKRKAIEIFISFLLEQRLSKEQIFELYANDIYLGQRGSFSIYGFGEGANAYFNKDVSSLTLAESALLAGIIRGPNLYNPYTHPARALERRNWVLRQMLGIGAITPAEAEKASAAPLGVARQNVEGAQAPYFVDMVKDQLLTQFSERDLLSQSFRIYTTLDMDMQKAASEAMRSGMADVDKELNRRKRPKGAPPRDPNQPQAALVSLDPQSGYIRALVGGRDYGWSQLNHVLAKRQPGSSFKPFVYAAALNSGVDGSQPLVTTATTLLDEPTSFQFGDTIYSPENYKQEYHGEVRLREALAHSLNVATVKLAEMVGYDKVRELAVAAGINKELMATPALALGAYVATPLEIAGSYTIFANRGLYAAPQTILAVKDSQGHTLWRGSVAPKQVLDPRVAYLMDNLMESVVNNGTGAGVRNRGFTLPAAGKTGTSHDGWFAGFTPTLEAVVWVGYDDDHELGLSGANSALFVWSDYMRSATALPEYVNSGDFVVPPGVVTAPVSPGAQIVSSVQGGDPETEVFIDGTQPQVESPLKSVQGVLGRLFGGKSQPAAPVPIAPTSATLPPRLPGGPAAAPPAAVPGAPPQKKSVIRRFFSIFRGESKQDKQEKKEEGSTSTPPPQQAGATTPNERNP
jgi:penicillin-binding protein 1B